MTVPIWPFLVLIIFAVYTLFTIQTLYKKYKNKNVYKKTGLSMIFVSLLSIVFIIFIFFGFQDMNKLERKLFSIEVFLTISVSFIYSVYTMVGGLFLIRTKVQRDGN